MLECQQLRLTPMRACMKKQQMRQKRRRVVASRPRVVVLLLLMVGGVGGAGGGPALAVADGGAVWLGAHAVVAPGGGGVSVWTVAALMDDRCSTALNDLDDDCSTAPRLP